MILLIVIPVESQGTEAQLLTGERQKGVLSSLQIPWKQLNIDSIDYHRFMS